MPDGCREGHHWWRIRKIVRELQLGVEEATLIKGIWWANDQKLPAENVLILAETNGNAIRRVSRKLCVSKNVIFVDDE